MPRITINVPKHIYDAARAHGLQVEDYLLELLRAAVISFGNEEEMMTQETPPSSTKRGRPATGLTREKRTINLEPRIWYWLESQATPEDKSFSDTCNRVIGSFVEQVKTEKTG